MNWCPDNWVTNYICGSITTNELKLKLFLDCHGQLRREGGREQWRVGAREARACSCARGMERGPVPNVVSYSIVQFRYVSNEVSKITVNEFQNIQMKYLNCLMPGMPASNQIACAQCHQCPELTEHRITTHNQGGMTGNDWSGLPPGYTNVLCPQWRWKRNTKCQGFAKLWTSCPGNLHFIGVFVNRHLVVLW